VHEQPVDRGVIGALLAGAILYLISAIMQFVSLWWLAIAAAMLALGVFPPVIDWLDASPASAIRRCCRSSSASA
jgi:hypothetical protein